MKIAFSADQTLPEVIISGPEALAQHGFTPETPIKLLLKQGALWVIPVDDESSWLTLCHCSDAELGLDVIRDNGELYLAGDWLTEIGITQASDIDMLCDTGVIVLFNRQRMKESVTAYDCH
ncbi:hypothetical protein [Limnobaculum parvum]|uniref:Type I addiction module toxin, SymE family n=1 Tax=Limnobaculum parvum TaxID=2172103 RepID=A0A2Y9TWC6_9GAMM|nr:hypothetical protein [Limnobaculum parvum]AWH87802.1 hypothetical protein HYN51_04035 [Limnobaculum parvum]AWH87809.1 hypothetical protein HYN51_04070 [Limnobaculum parvum]